MEENRFKSRVAFLCRYGQCFDVRSFKQQVSGVPVKIQIGPVPITLQIEFFGRREQKLQNIPANTSKS